MCGICGFVGNMDPSCLSAMVESIVHRGPDAQGEYHERFASAGQSLHIGLGHCRLSIIDLSEAGTQPMSNEDDTVRIVFNGEIYNFMELKQGLEQRGHTFKSRSDTEVILHLYEEKGEACVQDLQGMFAFAIWDARRSKLFIARDRLGIKPLYYSFDGENFIFASELKALLKSPDCPRDLNPQALLLYLTFLYVPSPLSIFQSVYKLPPAHCLLWEKGEIATYRYWKLTPRLVEVRGQSEAGIQAMIVQRLQETVASHLVSDVPLGVFLSGGMDSGTLVALMRRATPQPVKTFSLGYGPEAESYNELTYSRLLADHFGTEHHEYTLKPDVLELLPQIVRQMDEPFADSSAIPNFLISQVAREHVKVALSGVGGDELFGGYPRYLGARLFLLYERLPPALRGVLRSVSSRFPESASSSNAPGRIKRFFRSATLPREECYLRWVSFLAPEQTEQLFSPEFAAKLKGIDVFSRHRAHLSDHGQACHEGCFKNESGHGSGAPPGNAELSISRDWVDALQGLDIMTYLPDDLLVMCDKMSMAHSLEVRVPFCDHLLMESMMAIPSALRYKGFKLKSLMKRSFRGFLPDRVIAHRKQGFMAPLAIWLKGDLRNLVEDLLSRERILRRGYFRYSFVRRILDAHYSGKENLTDLIYALLVLELWHQLYLDC